RAAAIRTVDGRVEAAARGMSSRRSAVGADRGRLPGPDLRQYLAGRAAGRGRPGPVERSDDAGGGVPGPRPLARGERAGDPRGPSSADEEAAPRSGRFRLSCGETERGE